METIPQLIVEVRSKNDSSSEISEKVADYLKAGAALVWVVNDSPETVTEHRPGVQPTKLGKDDTLKCDDIIPGFRFSLADLFRG